MPTTIIMLDPNLHALIEKYVACDFDAGDALYHDLGIRGDEARELLEKYSAEFGVSLEGIYLPEYFPTGEYSQAEIIGSMFGREEQYKRLTIADLQAGIEKGYLGAEPSPAKTPPTPEEAQEAERIAFRKKNRLIFLPFVVLASAFVAAYALLIGLFVASGRIYIPAEWTIILPMALPLVLAFIFIRPRVGLLDLPEWRNSPRAQPPGLYTAVAALTMIVPTLIAQNCLRKPPGEYGHFMHIGQLAWTFITFAVGAIAFLALIHSVPFHEKKLREFEHRKRKE